MAGDWVKMRTDLADDPTVVAIASRIVYSDSHFQITHLNGEANGASVPKAQQSLNVFSAEVLVIGALWRLWSIANEQSENGRLPGYGIGVIDTKVGIAGFSEALAEHGWLRIHKWGLEIPNFDHHNGKSAKARAKQRVRAEILRTNLVHDLTHLNGEANGVSAPREEKRRDEEPPVVPHQKQQEAEAAKKPKPPVDATTDRFAEFWFAYPKKVAKKDAIKAWQKLKPSDELVQVILAAVRKQSTWEQWRREKGKYIPYAATWLNGARWEDADTETTRVPNKDFFVAPAQSSERRDGISTAGDLFGSTASKGGD